MSLFHLPRPRRRSMARIALGAALPLVMLTAAWQSAAAEASDESSAPDLSSDQWNVQVGAGALNGPRYPGSRYDFTRGLPFVSISYDRYFIGAVPGGGAPAGIGAYLVHTEHWSLGLDAAGDTRKPRRASDDPVLHGWGAIPGTARGGMFASYDMNWFSAHGSVSVGGHHEGTLASLGATAKYRPMQRLTLSIGPEVTWVNSQYAMTFFGVDAAQSEIAGIAPYQARSGINWVGGSAGASYMLTQHWLLATHVSYGRLQGDAADSPVTTDKTQRVYSAFVMYRF
jgi:outer membrane protein